MKAIQAASQQSEPDVWAGFVQPPEGYGEVAFYWWVGEPLTKERLAWQLEQLKDHRITGLQINYAHSDQGGNSWGLTMPSDPPLFSDSWWELFAWFAQKAGEYGMFVSLSDYTLCSPGQGWYTDEILREHPDMVGSRLVCTEREAGELPFELELPAGTLAVNAYRLNETGIPCGESIDLTGDGDGAKLQWTGRTGAWRIAVVHAERMEKSLDPMHPNSGSNVIKHFFQRFEDRLAGIPNAKLGFFFSDELNFGLKGRLWNDRFRAEFQRRKGYDIVPELASLFLDIDPRAPKVRLDYGDVLVSLSEDHYFRPVFEWHERRGLVYGCDHGGRGKELTEFGDYFRTQRWNQGPGCDQPNLRCDVIKNKVASSIAHLYERPRTWLEGFYSSGWGTSTAELTDAVFRNFVSGHNLLTLHGLYYTTFGGWWEWAPPCNHFRMPYWPHMKQLLACTERLSYLLSQGVHMCDVAIVYPVAAVEGGLDDQAAVKAAFGLGNYLYRQGIDFDYIDHESLERAIMDEHQLRVAGETYRVLILPAMSTVRYSTLRQAFAFCRAGGLVIALDALPAASERFGAQDPVLDNEVRDLFGWSAVEAAASGEERKQLHASGGTAWTIRDYPSVADVISAAFPRDFICRMKITETQFPYVMHRRIGEREVYAVYGIPSGTSCFFRCIGPVELWDPWSGKALSLAPEQVTDDGVWLRMPLDCTQVQLIVFTKQQQELEFASRTSTIQEISSLELNGTWEFELVPTLDNRFGDFRQPPEPVMIGPEARQFRYSAERQEASRTWHLPDFDDSAWEKVTQGYGPYFWQSGPLSLSICTDQLERQLCAMSHPSQVVGVEWTPYTYSTRYGIEGDPGHQGYHGLKGKMDNSFLAVGVRRFTSTGTAYEPDTSGDVYYLWSTFHSGEAVEARLRMGGHVPQRIWLNGEAVEAPGVVPVLSGRNRVLLRYQQPGRGYVVFERTHMEEWEQSLPLAMEWHVNPNVFAYDVLPEPEGAAAGWYRFVAPPGLQGLELTVHGTVRVWTNGVEQTAFAKGIRKDGSTLYEVRLDQPIPDASVAALRIGYDKAAYGGAAIAEPIRLICGIGRIVPGDWSRIDGLTSYSGEAVYRKIIDWPQQSNHGAPPRTLLQLGDVRSSAEVRINGDDVGILLAPPWEIEVSPWLKSGNNTLEIRVRNTLANHYLTIPTRYGGRLESGLLGPVRLVSDRLSLGDNR